MVWVDVRFVDGCVIRMKFPSVYAAIGFLNQRQQ